eukprot:TRINITY_DN3042_c0_g1::TRINITY_DN3042_c0_g1_i1::g.22256::m.22256 TRINITY_DN3042_c0_g1::TRINITY_DN3042_c0_g1_i1::g.22256  ORF type:complete len:357 (-),score=115.21,sp/P20353/GNAI_DROME/48.74/4e-118,G-alpha/PF00503.15/3.2e-122,Arf/PF00025.16/0.21,Arf/PF00025.16/4.4e-12,Miro/PF08477.8/76,Miro/PF08477.8/0.73,Gtr1_RagA/PF04670.7/9.4,Gtr1_RagA/PF04670.7/0.9,AAA_29/PF13555.1/0.084,MMR_HSR1/PF01926.18/2.6 TRINITY_DN3042_c0_g1_i1:589-1659(-)
MGNLFSSDKDKDERVRNKDISSKLKAEKEKFDREIKLLLLGAGDSGKSTVFKQIRLLYGTGFSNEDRVEFKEVIYGNIIQGTQALLHAADHFGFELSADSRPSREFLEKADHVVSAEEAWTSELGDNIQKLWADKALQDAFARRNEVQVSDSLGYYLSELKRINQAHYVPSVEDILFSRVSTTGITETEFKIEGLIFRIFDVGGQRNERSKWIHSFEGVTAVIFFVALSEYNQMLYEDENVNRMHESLRVFEEIINNKWFFKTPIMLFLNKRDLFEAKIKKYDLNIAFPEYNGGLNYDAAVSFIEKKFVSLNKHPDKRQIYVHQTCATDTTNVQFVFRAIRDIILQQNLSGSGLID